MFEDKLVPFAGHKKVLEIISRVGSNLNEESLHDFMDEDEEVQGRSALYVWSLTTVVENEEILFKLANKNFIPAYQSKVETALKKRLVTVIHWFYSFVYNHPVLKCFA